MSHPVISVENLSKAYRIGLKEEIPDTVVGAFAGWLKAPLRNWRRLKSLNTFDEPPADPPLALEKADRAPANGQGRRTTGSGQTDGILWALKNVSFEVSEGEVVGIIGRNGAGKSTLLRILSRITDPTHGRAVIRGRISSLLEVGTGFHPELTGRENLYMNGTILGLRKKEIDKKFDEIVEFSGVEKFLDTPIKRYSSGMQVRLAFAVAAHLEPEILIIDEVLAVGDAEFQKKCLGKMQDVAKGGRTVLFVSHNMAAVQNLCDTGILLRDGSIHLRDETIRIIDEYSKILNSRSAAEYDLSGMPRKNPELTPVFRRLRFLDRQGNLCKSFAPGEPIVIEIDVHFASATESPQFGIGIDDHIGQRVCSIATYFSASTLPSVKGTATIRCEIPGLPLAPGTYPLSLSTGKNGFLDQIEDAVALEIHPEDYLGNGRLPSRKLGQILCRSHWSVLSDKNAAALLQTS